MTDHRQEVVRLLESHHPNEIARRMGNEAYKTIHDIYMNTWMLDGWHPENVGGNDGEDAYALFSHGGTEFIDANGDYLLFETEAEAMEYINKFLTERVAT